MKGKKFFSSGEISEIKHLLNHLPNSSKAEKKKIRDTLRNLEFYITDYDQSYSGFTLENFEQLLESNIIITSD